MLLPALVLSLRRPALLAGLGFQRSWQEENKVNGYKDREIQEPEVTRSASVTTLAEPPPYAETRCSQVCSSGFF